MIRLCIFDLDGTLLDTVTSLWHCGNLALAAYGYEPLPKELYKVMVGDGVVTQVRRMLENTHGNLEDHEKVLGKYREYFKEGCMYEVKPYDGICELLESLKRKNIKIAVFSNKPHIQTEKIIKTIFGDHYFDIIFGQRDGVPKKPDPAGVYEIMNILKIHSEEVLYLGDTNTDMKTGKNAHLKTIGVTWGFRGVKELLDNGADIIVNHPLQVLNHLE